MNNDHVNDVHSPFYAWMDNEAIRELVHSALALSPGERLVLIKGLIPGLVDALGVAQLEDFIEEMRMKALRYEEARTHPGEGSATRVVPGEPLGGPAPEGHMHLDADRYARRPGGRELERRVEAEAWQESVPSRPVRGS